MDERFSMTVDQLLDGIRYQAFIARRSKGAKRRAAFVRVLDLASTARDYVVLGFPEPANHSVDPHLTGCPRCDLSDTSVPHNGQGDCHPGSAGRDFAQCSTCQGGPVCYCTDDGFPTTPQPAERESS